MTLWDANRYLVKILATSPLVFPGSMKLSFRAGGREWVSNRVDVILRPDPSLVGDRYDVFPIWGGELIYKDVPVRWSELMENPK